MSLDWLPSDNEGVLRVGSQHALFYDLKARRQHHVTQGNDGQPVRWRKQANEPQGAEKRPEWPTHFGKTPCLADEQATGLQMRVNFGEQTRWIVHKMKHIEGADRIKGAGRKTRRCIGDFECEIDRCGLRAGNPDHLG
jgi:hypothetical protein